MALSSNHEADRGSPETKRRCASNAQSSPAYNSRDLLSSMLGTKNGTLLKVVEGANRCQQPASNAEAENVASAVQLAACTTTSAG